MNSLKENESRSLKPIVNSRLLLLHVFKISVGRHLGRQIELVYEKSAMF